MQSYNTVFLDLDLLEWDQTCYAKSKWPALDRYRDSFSKLLHLAAKILQKLLFVRSISQKGLWYAIPLAEIALDTKFQ